MDAQGTKEIKNIRINNLMSNEYHKATAIPAGLLAKLEKAGITKFTLAFQGGSDEGYLEIYDQSLKGKQYASMPAKLHDEVEAWAYDSIGYSGAGDGSEYGDNFTYDLKAKTVMHDEWFHEHQSVNHPTRKFSELGEKSPSKWW